jgi:Major Facilitator Superfamily
MSTVEATGTRIRSTIPARLDRLSWSSFHTRMVAGLGAAWILDGLQITIASSVTGVLVQPDTLDMSSTEVGLIASVYLVGQVVGALVFGRLSDQLGRKRLLIITLLLYLFGTGLAAFYGERRRLAVARLVLRHPVHRGDGDRRPVRGDQFRNRRDDALEVPGPRRHLDQRHVLGGGHPRLVRLSHLPQRVCARCRLAPRLPDGAGPRDRRDHRGKDAAREPQVAHDSRPDGSSAPR